MGDWQANRNRDALERIVALLFALAGLADRATGTPFLRRRQVLGILSYGELEARAFLIGMVCGDPVPADALEFDSDAAHLAVRLRALALLLCILLAQAPQSALRGMAGLPADRPSHTIFRPTVHWLGGWALFSPDTS
jgi:hypothetical protein